MILNELREFDLAKSDRLLAHFERILPFCTPFAWALLVLVMAQLGRRLVAGASVMQLFRDRFYECPPVRALLWSGTAVLWLGFFAAVATAIRSGLLAYQSYERNQQVDLRLATWTAGALAAVVVLFAAGRRFPRFISEFRPVPPEVAVEVRHISQGIPQRLVARLGTESFPNQISRTWKAGLWLRRVVAWILGCAAAYVMAVYAWELFKLHDQPNF